MVLAGAEPEHRLALGAGSQAQRHLNRRARIQPGAEASGQAFAAQRLRIGHVAVAAEELATVAAAAARVRVHVEERGARGELGVVGIVRQQCTVRAVLLGDHVHLRLHPQIAQHPFHIAGRRQAPAAAGQVAQLQHRELHRLMQRHVHPQLAGDAVLHVLVDAVAEAMAGAVVALAAARQRLRRPYPPAVLVAQVERFAAGVADRVVVPRRQAELVRVLEPGVAGGTFAEHRAQLRIGQHVGPRRRGRRTLAQRDQVFATVGSKGAGTVVEQHLGMRRRERPRILVRIAARMHRHCQGLRLGQCGGRQRHQLGHAARRRQMPADLRGQGAALVADDDPRHHLQQDAVLLRDVLHRAHEDAAGALQHAGVRIGRDHAQDLLLQLLPVAALALVPDHQVRMQALEPPVRVRLHHLPHQFDVVGIADLQQRDRQIAGDRMAPQSGLAAPVLQQQFAVGAQRRMHVHHQPGQALVQLRIGLRGVDLAAHHLAVGPGQVEHAVGQAPVAVLFDQRHARGAVAADAVDHVDHRGLLRRQHDPAADRDHRVEHRTGGIGQHRIVAQRARGARGIAAAEEARAVGFVGNRADVCIVHRHQMEHPRRYLAVRAGAPRAQQRLGVAGDLGLHEQVAEGRMQFVGDGRRQHHFGIGGDLDGARLPRTVADPQAAQLDVVLGGDRHFQVRVEAALAAAELGLGIGEDRFVMVHFHRGGLVGGRPVVAAVHVAQVAETAPVVAGAVLAPAGDGHVAHAAVAAAGAGQQAVVAAVGEQLHRRPRRARIAEHAQLGLVLARILGPAYGAVRLLRMEHAHPRNPFLQ